MREKGTSVKKGNTGTRKRTSTKSVSRYKKTSNNTGGKPTRGFSLQHKTVSALNYAQDFGTTMKESLKRTTNSKGCTQEKSNCTLSNTFMPLSALSTMSLPSVKTVPKEVEVVMGDWIEKFRPV